MSLFSQLLSTGQIWLFNLLLLPVGIAIYRHFPRMLFVRDKALQHRFLAATVLLIIVWRININLDFGIIIHFLGMTTMTLMFGWPLAMVAALLAQLGFVLTDIDQLNTLAVNFILCGVLPAWFTWRLHVFVESYQPSNPFIYIMVTGFLSCLLSSILVSLVAITLLWIGGRYQFTVGITDYLGYLPLFIFPEAVVNGMLISGFSILHPNWMITFNDQRYFQVPHDTRVDKQTEEKNAVAQSLELPEDNERYRPPSGYFDNEENKQNTTSKNDDP